MPIQYAEITTIYDTENEGIFTNITRNWLGYETTCGEHSTIIISFDNENICVKDTVTDCSFTFFVGFSHSMPLYFDKEGVPHNTFFMKKLTTKDNGNVFLDITTIVPSGKYKIVPSRFNCIFYCYSLGEKDVFSILRMYSSEDKPRFLLSYDPEVFSRDELVYLVNCILTDKYRKTD